MAGHVNMMDDVLISSLPTSILRSALRVLVSYGAMTQKPFVEHVQARFRESPITMPKAEQLFPPTPSESHSHAGGLELSNYMALIRCLVSAKLAQDALPQASNRLAEIVSRHSSADCSTPSISHILVSITKTRVAWRVGDDIKGNLVRFGADIIQCVQALKESQLERTTELQAQLMHVLADLDQCRNYCTSSEPPLLYPFGRAERQVRDVLQLYFPHAATDILTATDLQATLLDIRLPSGPSAIETVELGRHHMPRLFNGLWQLSSGAWGSGTADAQAEDLCLLTSAGFTATDMADHYGDAELVYGNFRNRLLPAVRDSVYAATKWCIFRPIDHPITRQWVVSAVEERCRRIGGKVELLQFHWYDYSCKEYLNILLELVAVSKTRPDLVSSIGLCNFDTEHTEAVCQYLTAKTGSVGIVSNQVQLSVVDTRPLQRMCRACERYGLKLLTYGSFCGGFISQKWLGQSPPELYSETVMLTPSQRKYYDMINSWGTWIEFQSLLSVLARVAEAHDVSLANVAIRWVLQQPAIGAVIVGTRLGVSSHIKDNARVFNFRLSDGEVVAVNNAAQGDDGTAGRRLFDKLGDCGNEYRRESR